MSTEMTDDTDDTDDTEEQAEEQTSVEIDREEFDPAELDIPEDEWEAHSDEVKDSLISVYESAEAHKQSTGHDAVNGVLINHYPKQIAMMCDRCNVQLGIIEGDL